MLLRLRFLLLLLFIVPVVSFGQYEPGFLPEFFFGRQPSARAEALGRAYAATDGDLGSIYFNPAGIATIKRVEVNTSYTAPWYYLTKAYYKYYAAGWYINKYLQVALSRFHIDFGNTLAVNAITPSYTQKSTLTLASQPLKNLLIGANINYFVWQPGVNNNTSTTVFFDAGIIKKINLYKGKKNEHRINAGISLSNFTYASTKATYVSGTDKYYLPAIARYAVNYELLYGRRYFIDTVNTFRLIALGEMQSVINSKYRTIFKTGAEITLLNLLALRGGWYKETKLQDYGLPLYNNNTIKAFTYGFGVQIPLHLLTGLPVNINIDYTSLPQVSYSRIRTDWPNFNTYTLRLNYAKVRKRKY
jgi:hypothetical protein